MSYSLGVPETESCSEENEPMPLSGEGKPMPEVYTAESLNAMTISQIKA